MKLLNLLLLLGTNFVLTSSFSIGNDEMGPFTATVLSMKDDEDPTYNCPMEFHFYQKIKVVNKKRTKLAAAWLRNDKPVNGFGLKIQTFKVVDGQYKKMAMEYERNAIVCTEIQRRMFFSYFNNTKFEGECNLEPGYYELADIDFDKTLHKFTPMTQYGNFKIVGTFTSEETKDCAGFVLFLKLEQQLKGK